MFFNEPIAIKKYCWLVNTKRTQRK